MNITLAIKKIYPELIFNTDFNVTDKWNWPILTWNNIEIPQPTQAELETAWIEVEKEQNLALLKQEKATAINKIASLSDQLNLTAWITDMLVDLEIKRNPAFANEPWVIESKAKLNEIKSILNK